MVAVAYLPAKNILQHWLRPADRIDADFPLLATDPLARLLSSSSALKRGCESESASSNRKYRTQIGAQTLTLSVER